MLNKTQRSLLSILQDDTRCRILDSLNASPSHPDVLVEAIGVSRTAIEKHLKQLLQFGILERRTQTFPRLRYVYSLTLAAQNLVDAISISSDQFIDSTRSDFEERLTQAEQAFIFNVIEKSEYDQIKKDLQSKIDNLTSDDED
ncbi:MAG: winged helix-turn-helix transcriptional regulator [Candidatus Heimdallarchaeota archaeon]|nr:winged helix-turn-helix transcriptional regulator [Candidatus Heimdallarchaeota archaeon]